MISASSVFAKPSCAPSSLTGPPPASPPCDDYDLFLRLGGAVLLSAVLRPLDAGREEALPVLAAAW